LQEFSPEVDVREFQIVLVGHGKLAAALLSSAELICGPIESIAAVGLHAHETPEHFADAIRATLVPGERRILVLTDLLGGTPHNVAAAIAARDPRIVCISGVNLPMVVEAVVGMESLDELAVRRLVDASRDAISTIGRALARRAS
jgi:PTS system N-acetylgalactosamine-specific IIA component